MINPVTTNKHQRIPCSTVKPAAVAAVGIERQRIKPLAYDMLEQNLGKEASLDILRVFLGSTAELVVELQTAIRIQSYKEAAIALRELESSCTVVGAKGVLEQCSRLGEHLRNTDWIRLETGMSELVQETRAVGQFINELLSQALRGHFSR